MSLLTWIDENNRLYYAPEEGGTDIFDVQEAANGSLSEWDYGIELTAWEILEHTKFVYITPATLEKERWPKEEVHERPAEGLRPVGIIDIEEVFSSRGENE